MLYKFLLWIIRGLIRIVNGKGHFEYHEDYNPDATYVVVAPHRSLLDPIIIAKALYPKQVAYIGKKELFSNKFMSWVFNSVNVIPVDRDKPGVSTIKNAVRVLKDGDKHVGIFPTGSRFSDEIKPGSGKIAKMGNVDLLPVTYQGPIKISGLFSRKKANRVKCRVGKPIALPDGKRLTKDDMKIVSQEIAESFAENDAQLDPEYTYDVEKMRAEYEARKAK